jgi:hypothetical protein
VFIVFSLHQESPDLILGDEPLNPEVVLSHILHSLLEELGDWLRNLGEVQNEPSIIASQHKKTTYIMYIHWWLPFQHISYLAGVHRDSFL